MSKKYRENKIGERKEGMINVSSLFDKYKKILTAPEASIVNAFIEVVDDLYGWPISLKQVTYNPNTKILSIKAGGPLKTEMKLHKKEILNHLKGRIGAKSAPKDIL